MTAEPRSVRERILDAALSLLREAGGKKLAQPQVAKAAGVPQGHLTYYFPRRLDLLLGVVQRFAESAIEEVERLIGAEGGLGGAKTPRELAMALARRLIKDQERTRALLALVVESDAAPKVREAVADHTERLLKLLGRLLDRKPEDPDVAIALAALWGMALQHLVLGHRRTAAETDALLDRLAMWIKHMPPPKDSPSTRSKAPHGGSR